MPVFRSTYRLVKCKFCRGGTQPGWHFDEPGEMIVGQCHACQSLGWQVHYPMSLYPERVPELMVAFPATITIANPGNHGAAARLCIGQLKSEAFQEQLSAKKFAEIRRRHGITKPKKG